MSVWLRDFCFFFSKNPSISNDTGKIPELMNTEVKTKNNCERLVFDIPQKVRGFLLLRYLICKCLKHERTWPNTWSHRFGYPK